MVDRHYRADMIQVYKILNDENNIYPINFLELSERPGRKNSLKLFKRRSNLDIKKYSFTSRVVDLWNDLPETVVRSTNVNLFKHNLSGGKCVCASKPTGKLRLKIASIKVRPTG